MIKNICWVVAFLLIYIGSSYIYSITEPVENTDSPELKYERCIAAFAGNLERLPECDEYLAEPNN